MTRPSNLSILQRNTLSGLTDEAGALYLRGCERSELRAFWMACEWQERLSPFLASALSLAARPFDRGAIDEVSAFIRERHFRRYFPDGRQ